MARIVSMKSTKENNNVKHTKIYDTLYASIVAGDFAPNNKIPTEEELSKKFGASRPTVGKALQRLVKKGVIERRQGSGTFVKDHFGSENKRQTIGIIIPRTSFQSSQFRNMSSLFDNVLAEMSHAATKQNCYLLYNNLISENFDQFYPSTQKTCQQLIEKNVSGVLFFPLPICDEYKNANYDLVKKFTDAGIAVTLLDRDIFELPRRSKYDLVGSDHIDAGFNITEHLIKLGRQKIFFLSDKIRCSSTQGKTIGYKNAVNLHQISKDNSGAFSFEAKTKTDIEHTFDQNEIVNFINTHKPDGLVCMHDRMAAEILHIITKVMKLRVPEDISVVGFDDESFAGFMSVPLTTMRQSTTNIAECAIDTLLSRIQNPNQAPKNIQISTELIVRKSCGATS